MLYSSSNTISTATTTTTAASSNANKVKIYLKRKMFTKIYFYSILKFIQVPTNNSSRRRSDNSAKNSDETSSPLLSSNRKGSVSWQNLDKEALCGSKLFGELFSFWYSKLANNLREINHEFFGLFRTVFNLIF